MDLGGLVGPALILATGVISVVIAVVLLSIVNVSGREADQEYEREDGAP
jgi:hypothetical protein